jgi:hypothetical protein
VIFAFIALVVFAVVFCSAILGILLRRILPPTHLTDETKGVVILATGVVGTLTALVLGLLIAAANNSFNTKDAEIISMAAEVIQIDHLLRRYGPEGDELRVLLRRHTEMKIQDLFPDGGTMRANLESPRTVALLEELQDKLVALESKDAKQRWLQSQALQLVSAIAGTRWLLVEQNTIGIAVPLLVLVVVWLTLLFLSFGLFAPWNGTALTAFFLCALAAAGAIEMTLDLNAPFRGLIRISSKPMKEALDEISRR